MNDTLIGIVGVATAIVSGIVGASFAWTITSRRMPVSHRVAIIGYPQVGKTTLITGIFEYLFRVGAEGGSVVPRGDETIRRVNTNLKQMELGRPVIPTRDQDVFAFRADVVAPGGGLARRYKLEIGDFPGEDTVEFAEQYGEWLHATPYFQWAISSDAFLFVVDTASILLDSTGEEVARQKSALRAAWQRIREYHLDHNVGLSRTKVVLIYSKADLLLVDRWNTVAIRNFATGEDHPSVRKVNAAVHTALDKVMHQFDDLAEMLARESGSFETIATSIYLREAGDERFGIPAVVHAVLPHRGALVPVFGRRDSSQVEAS